MGKGYAVGIRCHGCNKYHRFLTDVLDFSQEDIIPYNCQFCNSKLAVVISVNRFK